MFYFGPKNFEREDNMVAATLNNQFVPALGNQSKTDLTTKRDELQSQQLDYEQQLSTAGIRAQSTGQQSTEIGGETVTKSKSTSGDNNRQLVEQLNNMLNAIVTAIRQVEDMIAQKEANKQGNTASSSATANNPDSAVQGTQDTDGTKVM